MGDAFVPQVITQEDVDRDLADDFKGNFGGIFTRSGKSHLLLNLVIWWC